MNNAGRKVGSRLNGYLKSRIIQNVRSNVDPRDLTNTGNVIAYPWKTASDYFIITDADFIEIIVVFFLLIKGGLKEISPFKATTLSTLQGFSNSELNLILEFNRNTSESFFFFFFLGGYFFICTHPLLKLNISSFASSDWDHFQLHSHWSHTCVYCVLFLLLL